MSYPDPRPGRLAGLVLFGVLARPGEAAPAIGSWQAGTRSYAAGQMHGLLLSPACIPREVMLSSRLLIDWKIPAIS